MSMNAETQEQTSPGTPKMKINTKNPQVGDTSLADIKRESSFSPRSPKGLAKSSSARCLCSPTTHAGSFRCRHHRSLGPGGMSRGGSVGSNLSLLGTKTAPIGGSKMNTCDSSCFE
ncbi:hypothetical protein AB3S75_017852 [Citrus x aurantiifolia]